MVLHSGLIWQVSDLLIVRDWGNFILMLKWVVVSTFHVPKYRNLLCSMCLEKILYYCVVNRMVKLIRGHEFETFCMV